MNKLQRINVAPGIYQDQKGGFWSRPQIKQGCRTIRTWRKLKATKLKFAQKEAAEANYQMDGLSFAQLAAKYLDSGCPDRQLRSRSGNKNFVESETSRAEKLVEYFGKAQADTIRIRDIPDYRTWRIARVVKGVGNRTVDMDMATLSNILSYGVSIGALEINYVRQGRPTFQSATAVKHANERAPRSGDDLNAIVDHLFLEPRSEVCGWMTLFAAMLGLRRSELVDLRYFAKLDENGKPEPGFIQDNVIYFRRSKKGINPKRVMDDALQDMVSCFQNWHQTRFPESPWYFPSPWGGIGTEPVNACSLRMALERACATLQLPQVTPHGLRSFFVTKLRRDGNSDAAIAEAIGDKTVELVNKVYGDFIDGKPLSYYPSEGLPAWRKWQRSELKVVGI